MQWLSVMQVCRHFQLMIHPVLCHLASTISYPSLWCIFEELDYGNFCLWYAGIPHDVNSFTAFMEALLGEDLFHHLSLPGVQRDIAAGILQVAGSVTEWGEQFEVPHVVLQRTRDVLQTLRDVSGSQVESLSDFLLGKCQLLLLLFNLVENLIESWIPSF